jgi:putative SOS response-associated peptidase YedK
LQRGVFGRNGATLGAEEMLKPFPAGKMEAWRVSKSVNNPRNDTPENLEKLNSK